MSFQKAVNFRQAKAVEGDFASTSIAIFLVADTEQMFAGDDKVKVGNFAWLQDGTVTGAKPSEGFAQCVFVGRNNGGILGPGEEGSLYIPVPRPVSAYVEGEFWARFTSNAQVGQKVFASTADGSVIAGTAGDNMSGYAETKFIVRTEAASGELVKISSWGVQ